MPNWHGQETNARAGNNVEKQRKEELMNETDASGQDTARLRRSRLNTVDSRR